MGVLIDYENRQIDIHLFPGWHAYIPFRGREKYRLASMQLTKDMLERAQTEVGQMSARKAVLETLWEEFRRGLDEDYQRIQTMIERIATRRDTERGE